MLNGEKRMKIPSSLHNLNDAIKFRIFDKKNNCYTGAINWDAAENDHQVPVFSLPQRYEFEIMTPFTSQAGRKVYIGDIIRPVNQEDGQLDAVVTYDVEKDAITVKSMVELANNNCKDSTKVSGLKILPKGNQKQAKDAASPASNKAKQQKIPFSSGKLLSDYIYLYGEFEIIGNIHFAKQVNSDFE